MVYHCIIYAHDFLVPIWRKLILLNNFFNFTSHTIYCGTIIIIQIIYIKTAITFMYSAY